MKHPSPQAPARAEHPRGPVALSHVSLLGIGSSVPERRLTNADLARLVDTSDEWIRTRTGIGERRILAEGQVTSDLGAEAARRALANSGIAPEAIDVVLVATATPDQPVPCTAAFVQEKIGARNAMGFDVDAGCTGFLYALQVGRALIASGAYGNALVIGADALSLLTDYQSRETCVLFGDAAGAVVLGRERGRARITDMQLGLDGRGAHLIQVVAGGTARPTSAETVAAREQYLRMNGREVFRFAVDKLAGLTRELCARNQLELDDIDLVIPHQANGRILDAAASALELPPERMFCNIEHYGNTSAATIPLALDEALRQGRIGAGQRLILAAFGAGLAWGGALLEFEAD
ncbi:MAG: ketoacyl-ACP synthase III [Planctomycetes bacterium]|nr:ketoacyl-ACP synthase III [Planctomycetota bacterium]